MPGTELDSHEPSEASPIELAKALKALRAVVTDEQYEKVRHICAAPAAHDRINRAVAGLREEDEFAIICSLMGTALHLVALEQRPLAGGKTGIPDFLARFQPACTINNLSNRAFAPYACLVEVKSTTKDRFRYGGSSLARLRDFAKAFNLPLLFAVRFLRFGRNALWIIVPDSTGRKTVSATYSELETGLRHVLWDEYWVLVRPDVRLRVEYDSMADGQEPASIEGDVQYGRRSAAELIIGDESVVLDPLEVVLILIFMECYDLEEVLCDRSDSHTTVLYRPTLSLCSIVDLVYKANNLITDEAGDRIFDASRLLARSDSPEPEPVITRPMMESIAGRLRSVGAVLGLVGMGDPSDHLTTWKRLGRVMP